MKLARGGQAIVHGLALDDAGVATARDAIRTEGFHGVVTVESWSRGKLLPYADNLVNTLIANLDRLAEHAPPRDEMLRVLIPGGTAYIQQRGRWQTIDKPLRNGSDDWTHFYHDAGGNPVSNDDLVGPPTGLQWIAGVAAAGADATTGYRLGEGRAVYEWRPPVVDKRDPVNWLICRDAYNGTLLWSKRTKVSPYKTRPIILADGRVYTHIEPEGPMVALDATTGEVVTSFDEGGRISKPVQGRVDLNAVWHDGLLVETAGNTVYVLDGRSGKLLWKFAGPVGSFMDYPTVLAKTKQLFVTNGATPRDVGRYPGTEARVLIAFDLETGKQQWQRELGNELSQLSISDGALYAFNLSGFIGRKRELFIARIEPKDGTIKWRLTPEHRGQLLDMAVIGKRMYVMSLKMEVFDTETGARVATYSMPGNSRCDMSRASTNYLLMSFGNFVDLATDPLKLERAEISRSTCGGGTTPGYGMLFYMPNRCQCFASVRGFMAASREPLREPVPDGERLQRGAGKAPLDDVAVSNDDWPMYLASPRRNSANGSQLPPELKLLWKVQVERPPPADAGPARADASLSSNYNGPITPATVAGGRAFVAVPEAHRVEALNVATGERLWSFVAGGRVDTPPTLHQNLCLFGCRDGWVYALDAATGKLMWRFLAAPYERKLVAYNQLESTWPLFGSVVISDGVLVAVAGRHPESNGGLFAWGLDPATGKPLWKQAIVHQRKPGELGGKIPDEGVTTRRYGYNANKVLNELLVSDGKLVATTGLVLEAQTGKIIEEPQIQRKDGKIVNPWTYPMSTYLDLGFRPPYRNQELENYGGPGADHGSWLLKLVEPKLEVHGELIAFNERRVAVTRVAGIEWAMWDLTKPFLSEGPDRNSPRRQNSSSPPHWSQPKFDFKDQAVKSLIMPGDKLVLGLGEFRGIDEKGGANAKPKSRAELRIYSADSAELQTEIDLPSGVIQSGLASANGRLFVSCEDGTLLCFGE